jgi:hypothetical protein
MQKAIDGGGTAIGLLFFQLDGLIDHLACYAAGLAPVTALLPFEAVKSALPVAVQFAPQGGRRWLSDLPVREKRRLFGQVLEKSVRVLLVDLTENKRF